MAKKPILRANGDGDGSGNRADYNALRAQVRKLSPKPGDVLVISGDTPGIDPEGFVRSVERFVPSGVRFLFIPDSVDVELMTEEMFNTLGYYRRHDESEEEE